MGHIQKLWKSIRKLLYQWFFQSWKLLSFYNILVRGWYLKFPIDWLKHGLPYYEAQFDPGPLQQLYFTQNECFEFKSNKENSKLVCGVSLNREKWSLIISRLLFSLTNGLERWFMIIDIEWREFNWTPVFQHMAICIKGSRKRQSTLTQGKFSPNLIKGMLLGLGLDLLPL